MQIKRFLKYFGIGIVILVGGFLIVSQIAYHTIPQIDPPGKIYSVNDVDIHLYCTGLQTDNKPTIIIIAGSGTPSPFYHNLQESLSESTRTCTYDRAGMGWSESNGIPANAKNMSNELHSLLQEAGIDRPLILAGHSLGGIVSLIYSAEHEEQVAGIAFIDSSHYNQVEYFGKEYSDALYKQTDELLENFWLIEAASNLGILILLSLISDNSELGIDENQLEMILYFDRWAPPYETIKSEAINFRTSFEQGEKAYYFRGDLPIISISASDHDAISSPEGGPTKQEMADAFLSRHKELADLSNNGIHVIVDGTNHMSIVQNEETAEHILSLIHPIEEK